MDKIVSLSKRKGFVFQSSEIYGGINSCYDYGPLGIELKRNIKDAWWKSIVTSRDEIEGLDAAILMHPRIWEASGHLAGFTDPMIDCKECKARFREDKLDDALCGNRAYQGRKALKCQAEDKFTDARQFNLMFKTFMGPVESDANIVFIRPETAQGIYVNMHNVLLSSRQKVPFGIGQIGKAFRNEITPGNFIFRTREFEQMEMQYFVKPGEDDKWFEYWKEQRMNWHLGMGITPSKLRFHEHGEGELAHYAKGAFDIEYEFPFGWQELEGIHNRTDFDLTRHQEHSGKELRYYDQQANEKYLPYIIETSAGCDRTLLTILVDAYEEEQLEKDTRVVMRFAPKVAPIKAGIFPLVKKEGMPEIAHKLKDELKVKYNVFYDESGAVGRRYRRMDEVGTPFCITIDSETLKDETVTIRERDSMQQSRVSISKAGAFLAETLE